MKTKYISTLVTAALVLFVVIPAAFFALGRYTRPACQTVEVVRTDTVIVRDTIRVTQQVPVKVYVVRTDTIRVKQTHTDTVYVEVGVPIERKVYQTADYRAEVEGFRPELVAMEVYKQTRYVSTTQTQTIKAPDAQRWGFGVQAGYGVSTQNGRMLAAPYIGVGVSYDIMRW